MNQPQGAKFGARWADVDHNGCDTRNDILSRDLANLTSRSGSCVVLSGVLRDPLTDAWQKGAFAWTINKRTAFANDPLELLAVDGPINEQKSDSDAVSWLPPNKAFRCAYVARQIAVKAKYGVWLTAAERDALSKVLAKCPQQALPDG